MKFSLRLCTVYLFLVSLFYCNIIVSEGFIADTLVRIPTGYACIQDLSVGDEVVVYNFAAGFVNEPIIQVARHEVESVIRLSVGSNHIEVAEDHMFFMPLQQCWTLVSQIVPNQYLLGVPLAAEFVSSVELIKQKRLVYSISLARHHNYLVTEQDIVVHNFVETGCAAAFAVEAVGGGGFLAAFLAANPLVAPVTIGCGAVGLAGYVFSTLISGCKGSKNFSKKNYGKKNGGSYFSNGNKGDNNSPGTIGSAVAFLKSLDDNKEKALEVFNKTCEYIKTTKGGIESVKHVFRANCHHNFGPLLSRMGADINNMSEEGEKQVIKVGTRILIDITQKLIRMGSKLAVDTRGVFENVVVEYGGELITIRGRAHENLIKIGTMFIQSQHLE